MDNDINDHLSARETFGPFKTSGSGKKNIFCMTDTFIKYVELVALCDKEAQTVETALFEKLICRHGLPLKLCLMVAMNLATKLWNRC